MDAREKTRLRMTRDVLRLLRTRDSRTRLSPLRDDVESAILVGFRDDTLKFVMERVKLLGGGVNVVVPIGDLSTWPSHMALLQATTGSNPDATADDECLVNDNSELGTLVELLRHRHRTMRLRLCGQEAIIDLMVDDWPPRP
ncbi:hypothetical protein ACFYY8_31835 [Streptosporangium sp. NPDC001559]|uniref:hypothetical protein n=1 Tax=Streptosporangium sp. NPDC001559 TaxID=3366187 RepID=UPI0036EFF653